MIKEYTYTYLGENGILTTPIFLPNVPCIKKVSLKASPGKKLKKDDIIVTNITVLESEINEWTEIEV